MELPVINNNLKYNKQIISRPFSRGHMLTEEEFNDLVIFINSIGLDGKIVMETDLNAVFLGNERLQEYYKKARKNTDLKVEYFEMDLLKSSTEEEAYGIMGLLVTVETMLINRTYSPTTISCAIAMSYFTGKDVYSNTFYDEIPLYIKHNAVSQISIKYAMYLAELHNDEFLVLAKGGKVSINGIKTDSLTRVYLYFYSIDHAKGSIEYSEIFKATGEKLIQTKFYEGTSSITLKKVQKARKTKSRFKGE